MNILMGKKTIGTIGLMGGVPSNHFEFTWSLANMIQYNNEYICTPGEIIHLDHADVSYHAAARNQLASRFLGDWLLMLDLDHAFQPDLLARMLLLVNQYKHFKDIDIGVLSALYHYRREPFLPVAYMWNDKKTGCQQMTDWESDSLLIEVDSAGAGCLLVKREIFHRIYEDLNEEPFSPKNGLSEDHSFFYRLSELGIQPYLAHKIQAAHLMTVPITTETHYRERFDVLSKAVDLENRH